MTMEKESQERAISLTELKRDLQSQFAGRIRHLQLLIDNGGVVLRGYARSQHAKQLVQSTILERLKVKIQANEIEVAPEHVDGRSTQRAELSCGREAKHGRRGIAGECSNTV